ncbi:hypothetical protein TcCL_ESM07189 [Trypanosoma cruzi]|nr:hypothetical protein TcCL_ESM07189 [Trypanosoma cruzi]
MAAACGCRSVLSGNMLPRFHVCVASGTMCRRLCGCRMEGEEWRSGVRERSGQESRWVSCRGGHCPPSPAPLLPGTLCLQDCIRRQQHAARQRMPHRHECDRKGKCQLLRSEGTRRVAQRRAQNLLAESAHDTGHWMWGVCVMEETLVETFLPPGGRTPEFPFVLTQADGCAMTPQRGSCFHDGGAISAGLRIGNVNSECSKKGSLMALFCRANCGDFS